MNNFIEVPARRWLTEEQQHVYELIGYQGFFGGGFCRWLATDVAHPTPYNDIDIWCVGIDEEVALRHYESICEQMQEHFGEPDYDRYYGKLWVSKKTKERYQVIRPRREGHFDTYGMPEEVVRRFDFTVCAAFLAYPMRETVVVHETLIRDEHNKQLILLNVHCPLAEMLRIQKYAKQGYRMLLTEQLKIFRAWDEVDDEIKTKWFEELHRLTETPSDQRGEEWEAEYTRIRRSMRFID